MPKPLKLTTIIMVALFLTSTYVVLAGSAVAALSSDDNWPMFHRDLTHTGYSNTTPTATSATPLWNFTTNSVIWASPAVVDGRLYIGSDGGMVYCLNASDGSKIWNYTIPARTQGPRGAFSSPIGSSMAVADGLVYFGCYDRNVYCLNVSTGERVWNFTTRNTVQSSPAVFDNLVYVGSWDGDIYCFDALTGAKVWNYTAGGLIESSPAVVYGRVFFGSTNFNVYCLDALSGAEIWKYTTGNIVQSSPTVVGNYVYIGSEDNNVYCLNASDGSKIWNFTTPGWVDSSPAVANGYVYVGSWEIGADSYDIASNVYCLNAASGEKIWAYRTHGGVNSSPAVAGGYVYVGGWDGNVYCVEATTGTEVWTYSAGNHVNSSPAIANGLVYVGSWDYNIYAFGVPKAASTPSSTPSPSVLEFPEYAMVGLAVSLALVSLTLVAVMRKRMAKRN